MHCKHNGMFSTEINNWKILDVIELNANSNHIRNYEI